MYTYEYKVSDICAVINQIGMTFENNRYESFCVRNPTQWRVTISSAHSFFNYTKLSKALIVSLEKQTSSFSNANFVSKFIHEIQEISLNRIKSQCKIFHLVKTTLT